MNPTSALQDSVDDITKAVVGIFVSLLEPEIPCFTRVFIVKMWKVVYYHYQCDYNGKRC